MFWVLFLLPAIVAAGFSCGRLCLAAVAAARPAPRADRERGLSCYEAAFLAGGPDRVTDLTLVSMHRARRLLLAHTGWATVVEPEGRDDLERSVLTAIGPGGQERIAAIRSGTAAADAVHALAERLAAAGLAVPDAARSGVATSVRAVRAATLFIAALAVTALLMPGGTGTGRGQIAAWFALPLVLTLGCLAIARVEIHPYTRWASPDGQRLLGGLDPAGDPLTAVAVRGIRAVDDPQLRTALTRGRFAHRGQ
ncbi:MULTISPECIES: TIGR04222 domain-containing membrane protein [unclassified Streptomyces]|uniref:TIGR04222 domain-containing membrane protein n=1 Tax=unclassified Streptomyces TaxID=2593676 RepID=UPI0038067E29